MSCWGMGITQSDEYCDVYERFMQEYDEGKPVGEITADILEEYLCVFEENDGILHDVYFAIGKAEWMCGGISDLILERIRQIIESGDNLDFLRELETEERELRIRQKNLEKFLSGLTVSRGKTRKRKKSIDEYLLKEKPIPLPMSNYGDTYCYEHENSYRVFTLMKRIRSNNQYLVYSYAWIKSFDRIPTYEELLKEHIRPLGTFKGETFPSMEKLTYIGNYPAIEQLSMIYPRVIHRFWKCKENCWAKAENLLEEYPEEICMTLEDILAKIKYLRDLSH